MITQENQHLKTREKQDFGALGVPDRQPMDPYREIFQEVQEPETDGTGYVRPDTYQIPSELR